MTRLRLVLDLHCHQPIGNFGWVIEKATAASYRPLLEELARRPDIPFVLHVSGPLLEWWEEHARDLVELVKAGVSRGQIELQASGLFEPILPAIPRRDRVDQVRLHRSWLRDLFGADVTSLWLTERVWEPSLPYDLAAAGIRSVLVDDTHFEGAGLRIESLDGYYTTEDEGRTVFLFPISKRLRYLIPFKPVAEILAFLKERHAAGQRLLVFGDDGEKFGLWPGTQEWVYGAGWLKEFLGALEANADWLQVTTLRETTQALPPTGRVYLPTSSYFEMGHWALPPPAQRALDELLKVLEARDLADAARPFLRGATWRNFLARYPEANLLQQRMVRVSELTRRMGLRPPEGLTQLAQLHPAVRALFRGQCNCAYWHGVFGGLYLPFLRDTLVDELLEARARLEALRGDQAGAPHAELVDLDADGRDDVLLEGHGWSAWIAPTRGGMVDLLDHWPTRRNLLNVIARREEAYHAGLLEKAQAGRRGAAGAADAAPKSIHELAVALEGDVAELLRCDPRRRGGFVLELAPGTTTAGALAELRGPDLFGVAEMELRLERPVVADRARVDLAATIEAGRGTRLDLRRSFELLADGTLEAGVALAIEGRPLEPLVVALRLDLSVPGGGLDERRFVLADGSRIAAGVERDFTGDSIELCDERGAWRLEASRPCRAALRPIRTVSRSEGGVDTCLQGTCLVLAWDVLLAPREAWRVLLRLRPLTR